MKRLLVLVTTVMMSLPSTVMAKEEEKVLDLRIVDMGYRWVQNLERSDMHTSRAFMTFGVTHKDYVRFGWERRGISNPFSNDANENVMFQWTHKFESM
jgi:hypothetical protein